MHRVHFRQGPMAEHMFLPLDVNKTVLPYQRRSCLSVAGNQNPEHDQGVWEAHPREQGSL